MQSKDLRGQDLRGADLRGCNLLGALLDDTDLRGADLWGANIANASLRRADLRGANLMCSSFAGSDLRCAKLAGAELRMCDLGGAHLACVDLGRPRTGFWFGWATRFGAPSFGDALEHYIRALHLRGGDAMWCVDAAIDASDDIESEVMALLVNAARVSIACTACLRWTPSPPIIEALWRRFPRCRQFELRTVAATLLLLGQSEERIANTMDRADLDRRGPPQDRLSSSVHEIARGAQAWPSPDSRPPPYGKYR